MGGSIPSGTLRAMYYDLSRDARKSDNPELDERILKYCLSNGDKDLWPDLRAAINGRPEYYSLFFQVAEEVIDDISGVDANRKNKQRYLTTQNAALTPISALYQKIVHSMKNSNKK